MQLYQVDKGLDMEHDFLKNERKDRRCRGTLKCLMIEPALAAFFGVKKPTELEVPVEFLVHNTWCFHSPNKDQYLTLVMINGIELEYKVPYTSQESNVDLWESIDTGSVRLNIMLGIDRFYITNIEKQL